MMQEPSIVTQSLEKTQTAFESNLKKLDITSEYLYTCKFPESARVIIQKGSDLVYTIRNNLEHIEKDLIATGRFSEIGAYFEQFGEAKARFLEAATSANPSLAAIKETIMPKGCGRGR